MYFCSSLGVHISFVRSIAMDSWSDKQLALMKNGGNKNCNDYLKARGIDPRTPIKAKYESDAAQLYKEVLKARVEGRPEPTTLPPPKNRNAGSGPSSMNSMSSNGSGFGSAHAGGGDPNGMERLAGETDQQYIARQTRLKEEARARMAAKFGNSGGRMGGVGSSMQGIGSNPSYNPSSGGYGGGPDLDSVVSSVSGAFSSGLSFVSSVVNDESTRSAVSNLGSTATSYGGSFWSSLKNTVSDVATSIAQPDDDDGLSALQREVHAHVPSQSKYAGFGSSTSGGFGEMPGIKQTAPSPFQNNTFDTAPSSGGALQEAAGLPGEDRNGVERLTGETDEQYVLRQTRLRDEAKARMAAKFGGGGLSSASSSGMGSNTPARTAPTTSSTPPPSYPSGMSLSKAPAPAVAPSPASGGFPRPGGTTPARKNSKDSLSGDDFFASFGA
jgi:ADP-ribosylation factor GTPase-activating protein 1